MPTLKFSLLTITIALAVCFHPSLLRISSSISQTTVPDLSLRLTVLANRLYFAWSVWQVITTTKYLFCIGAAFTTFIVISIALSESISPLLEPVFYVLIAQLLRLTAATNSPCRSPELPDSLFSLTAN